MQHSEKSTTVATGLAMFSMFFGAGNVVFPLALGQYAKDKNFFAILGLLITAVGVPFLGLISMILFNGDYKRFFWRIGPIPGFLLAAAIMGLIGPFGAIPRCITLSYSTIGLYLPDMSFVIFSIISCVIIFLFTFRPNRIVEILGYFLTPLLLISLAIIIIKGIITAPPLPQSDQSGLDVFITGLTAGYQTMDLLGAFFFAAVILSLLERDVNISSAKNYWHVMNLALKATAIGATLLSLTYIGFSYTSAYHSESLNDVSRDVLIGKIAILVLGPYAGLVASAAVALACLTTAIALSAVFAEFIHKDISLNKVGYTTSLVITLVISFFVSTLRFEGIANFLVPILHVCYPALIALSILNLLFKLYHFKPVKVPVFIVFVLSLLAYTLP